MKKPEQNNFFGKNVRRKSLIANNEIEKKKLKKKIERNVVLFRIIIASVYQPKQMKQTKTV